MLVQHHPDEKLGPVQALQVYIQKSMLFKQLMENSLPGFMTPNACTLHCLANLF